MNCRVNKHVALFQTHNFCMTINVHGRTSIKDDARLISVISEVTCPRFGNAIKLGIQKYC